MILNGILILIFIISFALLFGQGIWSNVLTLINVILAALLATAFFEPLATYLDSQMPTFTYIWDYLALWGLFAIFYIIFRTASDALSKTRVRFKQIVDLAGGSFFALWTSWVLVCFTTMSLHTAPLARNAFMGSLQPTPEARMFFGLAPDQQWLGFTQKISAGAFSTSPPEGVTGENDSNVFDPEGKFVFNYAERRARFEKELESRVFRGN
jgi:uncharacterized membrane protein required for colicin V production